MHAKNVLKHRGRIPTLETLRSTGWILNSSRSVVTARSGVWDRIREIRVNLTKLRVKSTQKKSTDAQTQFSRICGDIGNFNAIFMVRDTKIFALFRSMTLTGGNFFCVWINTFFPPDFKEFTVLHFRFEISVSQRSHIILLLLSRFSI